MTGGHGEKYKVQNGKLHPLDPDWREKIANYGVRYLGMKDAMVYGTQGRMKVKWTVNWTQ